MPWWAWALIWTALVLFFLAVFAFLLWRLFRKFMVLTEEGAQFTEQLGALGDIADAVPPVRPVPAVLLPLTQVQDDYRARMRRREDRAQSRRDRRHERGKRIIAVDATTTEWPAGWSKK